MRPALERLLGSPSALSLLRNAIQSSERCQTCWIWTIVSPKGEPRRYSAQPQPQPVAEDESDTGAETIKPGLSRQRFPKAPLQYDRVRLVLSKKVNGNTESSDHSRDEFAARCGEPDTQVELDKIRRSKKGRQFERTLSFKDLGHDPVGEGIPDRVSQVRAIEESCQGLSEPTSTATLSIQPPNDWRDRLKTGNNYKYESSIHLPAVLGPRLVDFTIFASNFELWLELVLFRRRTRGPRGLIALWKEMRSRKLELPTKGDLANRLWHHFVEMGLECLEMLPDVIQYAIELWHSRGRYWKGLYLQIVRDRLKDRPEHAITHHEQMYRIIAPTAEQFLLLFGLAHKNPEVRNQRGIVLRKIYKDLGFKNLYKPIMERMYQREDFDSAVKWHKILMDNGDLPADIDTYRPLFRYMALYGNPKTLAEMVHSLVKADLSLPSFVKHPLPINPTSQALIDARLAEVHGIMPKIIDDEFCARIFATTWFSFQTILRFLHILGAKMIGAHSLRAVAVRVNCVPQDVNLSIHQLETAGIILDNSTFCILVRNLARAENNGMLGTIIHCDLHPDTFEDKDLQETLLSAYYNEGDQRQVDRTLAILLAKHWGREKYDAFLNIQLRLQLKQKNMRAISSLVELMHVNGVPLEAQSGSYMRSCLLSPRRRGRRPRTTKDLPFMVNIFMGFIRSGSDVPCIAWIEILRRLGMAGELDQYEKLALWLANHYSTPRYPSTMRLLPGSWIMSREIARRIVSVPFQLSTKQRYHRHPLQILFPPKVQQAIVAWGFQHAKVGSSNWRWGLQLLLKLKMNSVHIVRGDVAFACKRRLGVLFSPERSDKSINNRIKASNATPLGYYFREMEKIGGKALFFGPRYPKDDEKRIKILVNDFRPLERKLAVPRFTKGATHE